ncbi:MAG: potassium channel family protein [Acidibrevibacterium sp.]|jgi:voltage-gated potassium channel|uniref:potassium channel family protein n=1 Tax=Acidibrevibacterium fodinaquatile TaxID=1969806 RepID=UPI0023A7F03B|nr:potassium channel family protein [Acidibrevibacterium fodinaquatile]MCA7118125.1 potassium channel family protein [Acidibrevibacterium fodinaquatile]
MAQTAAAKRDAAMSSWLRALLFTLILVGLVSVAAGEDWKFDIAALAICATGFGFFFVAFSGGMHFGITFANFLAVYACTFFFFRESNFPKAGHGPAIIALAMPVLIFLGACFVRLRQINAVLHARRRREITALPTLWRWIPGVAAVGAATFALPRLHLAASDQEVALLVSMAVVSGFIAYAARDVVLLLNDVALIFEGVAHRIDRLMIPMTAFMTLYSLLVVVFACLYRLAEMSAETPQFLTDSADHFLSFGEAMYFSIITLSTVGYGDIVPVGQLVRLLAAGQVIVGLLLLLFGFSEIARMSDEERAAPPAPKLPD